MNSWLFNSGSHSPWNFKGKEDYSLTVDLEQF